MKPRELVEAWVEAFNSADAELIASYYWDDAINHQVAEGKTVGREAIKNQFIKEFSSADMVCMIEKLFEDGEWAILEWKDPLGLRGCGFFQVQNGKIKHQRGYWDKLTFLRQHGLPIPEK